MPSSMTTTFSADILPDSAALWLGATGSGVPLGATRGGIKISPDKKFRNAAENTDGVRSMIYLLDRIVSHELKVSGKLQQYGPTTIVTVEPGMSSTAGSGAVSVLYTPQPGSVFLTSGSYLANLRVVFLRTNQTYFQIRIPRALCTKYELASKDKDETEIDFTFESRLDLGAAGNTTDTAPYVLEQLTTSFGGTL
jgi:hypothetical protein